MCLDTESYLRLFLLPDQKTKVVSKVFGVFVVGFTVASVQSYLLRNKVFNLK